MRTKYLVLSLVAAALVVPLGSLYYHYESGAACARCHEIEQAHGQWRSSSHRNVSCSNCHGSALTFDVAFHWNNLRRVVNHFRGAEAEEIHLTHRDLFPVAERCANCHRTEFAQWQSGPHSATYGRIFLNPQHNTQRKLMDDCLRCHGMHFDGSIRDLVSPVSVKGPWKLLNPELVQKPAIPCLSCHQMHGNGAPLEKRPLRAAAVGQETIRPSVGLYDRREQTHVPVRLLVLPAVKDGTRPVKMSPDPRQALCYQCHAPLASLQAGSGDDHTGVGVHEGISCLTCHAKHSQQTVQSCKTCHPKMSNCGLDVEKMDTTFKDKNSRFNIHTVKCVDCHPKGVPQKRTAAKSGAAG